MIASMPVARKVFLSGLAIAITGAILFSAKAIVAKLIYRYPVDAVTLIAFRMLFSFPFFLAIAVWQARVNTSLTVAERGKIVLLGLVGYYLSSFEIGDKMSLGRYQTPRPLKSWFIRKLKLDHTGTTVYNA